MEKYFIVTEENKLRKDYMDYLQNVKDVNEIAKNFMMFNDIETTEYYCSNDAFYIVPKGNDIEKYSSVLMSDVGYGLRRFKKNSKIGKAWINTIKDNDTKVLCKPYLPFYFKGAYGHMRTNLFMLDNIVYAYMMMEEDFETPEGMTEIKASEYYKVIEDHKDKFLESAVK